MYLLTNVAKTQDVPLDVTIFSGNTGQKDRATFMKKIFLYSYPKLSRSNLQASETDAVVSAFLSFIKSWHDVKVSK